MTPSIAEVFVGGFWGAIYGLAILLGVLTALGICFAAGWVLSWSIQKLWQKASRP